MGVSGVQGCGVTSGHAPKRRVLTGSCSSSPFSFSYFSFLSLKSPNWTRSGIATGKPTPHGGYCFVGGASFAALSPGLTGNVKGRKVFSVGNEVSLALRAQTLQPAQARAWSGSG